MKKQEELILCLSLLLLSVIGLIFYLVGHYVLNIIGTGMVAISFIIFSNHLLLKKNIIRKKFLIVKNNDKCVIKLPGEFHVIPILWRWIKPKNWKVGFLPSWATKPWAQSKDVREWIKHRSLILPLR